MLQIITIVIVMVVIVILIIRMIIPILMETPRSDYPRKDPPDY